MRNLRPDDQFLRQEGRDQYLEKVKALEAYLASVSEELTAEGVPVDSSLRVDMDAFGEVYSSNDINRDKMIVEDFRNRDYPGLTSEQRKEAEIVKDGTQLEMLKSAIFHANTRGRFIVCRTSQFDDIENGVDNIIIDRKTGKPICALDEVGDVSGEAFEKKKGKVMRRNFDRRTHGAQLKYGLYFEKGVPGEKRDVLKKGKIANIPTFYLALPRSHIRKGIESFHVTNVDPRERR